MSANASELTARPDTSRSVAVPVAVLYGFVLLALIVHFALYSRYALAAIRFPFELDYGEGIVWQQTLLIPGERMYGDITRYPFIVFHYPPLYHLAVRAGAALGLDMLAAGRGISVLCTLLIGGLAAVLAHDAAGAAMTNDAAGAAMTNDAARSSTPRAARLTGAAVAGLSVFCYWPVVCWSPLMRVDMLAIMLDFLGVLLAARSARQPRLLYFAVLAFVLAVYTKQTSIAAPLAVLLVIGRTNRPLALKAFGLGLVVGLAGLIALSWMTQGGFLRHLLFYNLNRFSLAAAAAAVFEEWPHAIFLALAMGGLAVGWQRRPATGGGAARLVSILALYLLFSTFMLVTLGKSGGKLNYMIEWMCLWSVLIGVFVASSLGRCVAASGTATGGGGTLLTLLIPIALLGQVIVLPTARDYSGDDAGRNAELAGLVGRIRAAPGPVLSDDMVLLMKAGKAVPWEPSIFAELASTGRWDERLITDMIAARTFSFVITRGHPGDELFDSRYTPTVDRAIEAAYPRTEEQGGRTLHFPPG